MGEPVMVPYYAHEGEMARMERANKRLWILVVILVFLLVGTNVGWLVYEAQFAELVTTTEIEAEQDGNYNFVSGGDLSYGTESTNQNGNEDTGASR